MHAKGGPARVPPPAPPRLAPCHHPTALHPLCIISKCPRPLPSASKHPILGRSVQQTEPGLLRPHHRHPGRRESGPLCLHMEGQGPRCWDTLPAPQLNQHALHTPCPPGALPSLQLCSCLLSPQDASQAPLHSQWILLQSTQSNATSSGKSSLIAPISLTHILSHTHTHQFGYEPHCAMS